MKPTEIMTLEQYKALQATLPEDEAKHLRVYYMYYTEVLTWPQYIDNGYSHIFPVDKDKTQVAENAIKAAKEVEEHILKEGGIGKTPGLSCFPTELTMTTIFHIIGKNERQDRKVCIEMVHEDSWGSVIVNGPKLSIYDESMLLSLIFLAAKNEHPSFETTCGELCRIMKVSRGRAQYKSIEQSLDMLSSTTIKTILTKNGKPVRRIKGSIISNLDEEISKGKATIDLNPYFLEMYGKGMVTTIDMAARAELKGDVTKALYRFISTHKDNGLPYGLKKLAQALRIDPQKELKKVRALVKNGLEELHTKKHIREGWRIDDKDRVFIPYNHSAKRALH